MFREAIRLYDLIHRPWETRPGISDCWNGCQVMARPGNQSEIAEEPNALGDLSRSELVERWTTVYGHPPPKGLSRRILEYSAAYHLQAKAFGGLSRSLKRQLAKGNNSRTGISNRSAVMRTAKAPPPGSRLVREWHGISHTVDVTEGGFVHRPTYRAPTSP